MDLGLSHERFRNCAYFHMRRLGLRLPVVAIMTVMTIAILGCAGSSDSSAGFNSPRVYDPPKSLDLDVTGRTTYIGPQVSESIEVFLTESYGFDYKINMSCTFMNVGRTGSFEVIATVYQSDKSWERRRTARTASGQIRTLEFEFDEPTFDDWARLAPLALLVITSPWGFAAAAVLEGQSGGQCQTGHLPCFPKPK